MKCRIIMAWVIFAPLLLSQAQAQGRAEAGFTKLKSLEGEWEGLGPNGLKVILLYEVVAGGSAVMETRMPTGEPSMISIFHLAADKLMMTHYCSIGNQPRMQSQPGPEGNGQLDFALLDVTNLSEPGAGHMRSLKYVFKDKDNFRQTWIWREAGEEHPAVFDLKRRVKS